MIVEKIELEKIELVLMPIFRWIDAGSTPIRPHTSHERVALSTLYAHAVLYRMYHVLGLSNVFTYDGCSSVQAILVVAPVTVIGVGVAKGFFPM